MSSGEISEWKNELYSKKKSTIVAAVKKVSCPHAVCRHHRPPLTPVLALAQVIAAMTVGKDVSMLFPDVINCMQTGTRACFVAD